MYIFAKARKFNYNHTLINNEFMKSILFLIFITALSFNSNSQTYVQKNVEAELKNHLKNPYGYFNSRLEQNARLDEMQKTISDLSARNSQLNLEKTQLEDQLSSKDVEINSLKQAKTASMKNRNDQSAYRVQLAVSEKSGPMPDFKEGSVRMANENGKTVYYISGFNSPEEAFNWSQSLRKMNLKGAFVTKYENGVRDHSYDYLKSNNIGSINSYSSQPVNNHSTRQGGINYDKMQDNLYDNASSNETLKSQRSSNSGSTIQVVSPSNAGSGRGRLVIENE